MALSVLVALTACNENKSKTTEKEAPKVAGATKEAEPAKEAYTAADSTADASVKGYTVKLVEGKHKYSGGYTRIKYSNTLQTLDEARANAKKKMTADDELASDLQSIREIGLGGTLRLDIGRGTIGAANTKWFTIVIKDMNDKELFRKQLDNDIPETPSSGMSGGNWWNIDILGIDKKIRPPFYVYVADQLQDAPFKFLVSPK